MADRAVIEVAADVARYQAELAKIPGITDKEAAKAALKLQQRMEAAEKKAAQAAERAADKAAQAASGLGRFSEQAELFERMRSALGPLGDSLADLTGGANNIASALGKASLKQVAFVGGMVALGAAALKAAGAVADVLGNVEAYADNIRDLEDRQIISADDARQLKEASAALDTLSTELTNLAVSIAATVAPAVGALADLLSGMFSFINAGLTGISKLTNYLLAWDENASEAAKSQRELNEAWLVNLMLQGEAEAKRAKEALDAKNLAEDRAKLAEMFAKDEEQKQAAARAAEQRAAKLQSATEQLRSLIAAANLEEAQGRDKIALKTQQQIDHINEIINQHPTLAAQANELIAIYERLRDRSIEAFNAEERKKLEEENARRNEKLKKQVQEITAAYREQQEAMQAAQDEMMRATAESVVSIVGNIENSLASVSQMFDTSTRQGKKAARNMAEAQRVLAIFQVGINLAQAIAQSLAQGGPVAGAALAAAVTAAFAGIIATVSRPVPQFHTGRFGAASGMLGDERMTGGVMTVQPEVVIPPDLVSRAGGADGVRSRLEDDRPLIVQAVIDLADERIVLPLSRAMGARERTKLGVPLGRS